MEGINGTLKTLRRYYKRRSSHQQNSFSNKKSEHKDPLKTPLNLKKIEKEKNTVRYPKTTTRRYTWIQRDSNLTSLGSLRKTI